MAATKTILEGSDVAEGIRAWCRHNTRYRGCTLVIRGYRVHIRDVIIWHMDDDTIDVAQYGQNVSAFIAMVDSITGIELREVAGRQDWLRIWME